MQYVYDLLAALGSQVILFLIIIPAEHNFSLTNHNILIDFADIPENCSKPTIDNANVSPLSDSITAGESYTVTCNENYNIYGSNTMECNDDGNLSTAPTCISQ